MKLGLEIYVLGIVGSPRPKSNTAILVKEALDAAGKLPGVKTGIYTISNKRIATCIGCLECTHRGKCIIEDDFQEFYNEFMKADGVIIGTPVYVMSVPSKLKACIERLANSIFAHTISLEKKFPRLCKAVGVISQGNRRYGGEEIVQQYIVDAFTALKCIVVSGDFPDSYIGVGGYTLGNSEAGSIIKDQKALELSRNLGVRVAEMAKIIKTGLLQLKDQLPDEYFQK